MTNPNPTTGKPPRGSNTPTHSPSFPSRKRTSSNLSSKTGALREPTGLTETLEERINAMLKRLARDLHGEDWSGITAKDRSALCRKVAAALRKETGKPVSTDQVRTASQRMRNTPEVRTAYPVDLEPEEYAYIAYLHATQGGTMKAINSEMVRFYREHHA